MYDLLIRNAFIVDGSGAPGYGGDLTVLGERIAEIGSLQTTQAHRTIDADGLVACPGFVDIHSHSDYHLLVEPLARSSLHQGVTLEIGGNCGYSSAPIWGEALEERRREYRRAYDLDLDWSGFGDYLARLERQGTAINFGLFAGHNTLRASAMGGKATAPSADELGAMVAALRQAIQEGALGLSTGLAYAPACFAERAELKALARTAREEGGILASHIRSEGAGLLEAIEEIIDVAEAAGLPLQLSHLKTYGQENWGKLDRALDLIESAQRRGVKVTCDRYPYLAANTGLQSILPTWAREGLQPERVARLRDPALRQRMKAEILQAHPDPAHWTRVMIAEVSRDEDRRYEGKRLAEAAALAGAPDALEFAFDLLARNETLVDGIFFTMSLDNLRRILAKPYVMIGSDSGTRGADGPLARGRPHPRTFGTFPAVLRQFVREERLLSLSQAIRKMTADPCRKIGVHDRGILREGAYADLVLFDPETIADQATYEQPLQYARGLQVVLVNGQVALEAGEHLGVRAGRVLRRTGSYVRS